MPFAPASLYSVRAGALRQSVTVRARTVSRDAATGEETAAYADSGAFRAEVVPLTAAQAERAGIDVAKRPHRITARNAGDAAAVAPGSRLVWDGLTLSVVSSVDLGGRSRAREILATATT